MAVVLVLIEGKNEDCELSLLAVAFVCGGVDEADGSGSLGVCEMISWIHRNLRVKIESCAGKILPVNYL